MSNEITVTISGKDNLSDTFDDAGKGAKNYGDKLGDLGDKADASEQKIMGAKDTVDGLTTVLQGPGKVGVTGYIQGWADLASGMANFVIPSIKLLVQTKIKDVIQTVRSTAANVAHRVSMVAGAVATKAMTIAQRALNVVMRANPIGIIITVLAAMVAGIIYAYKHSEKFRKVVDAVWKAIKTAAVTAWNFIKGIPEKVKDVFAKAKEFLVGGGKRIMQGLKDGIVERYTAVRDWVKSVPGKIKDRFVRVNLLLLQKGRDIIQGLKNGFAERYRTVSDYVKGIPNKLRDKFSSMGTKLKEKGKQLINGLKDGVVEKMRGIGRWVKDKIVNPLVAKVKEFFGIKSPSTVFAGMGKHLVGGLVQGMMSAGAGGIVRKVFGGMPAALKAMVGKGLAGVKNLPKKAMDALGIQEFASQGPFLGGGSPVDGASVRRHSGYPWAQWAGDLNGPGNDYGQPVRAWQSGFIDKINYWNNSYGTHIRMRHQGANTLYAHLSEVLTRVGAHVNKGQVIGRIGETGNAFGAHLHWEKYGRGGVINEPIYGLGSRTGKGYLFGEAGPETITPGVGGGGATVIELHVGDRYLGQFIGQQIREHDRGARRKVLAGDNGGF